MDPGLFIVVDRGRTYRAALEVCATCPVTEPCLDYALEADEELGVWGGTTPRARRALRRGQRKEYAYPTTW